MPIKFMPIKIIWVEYWNDITTRENLKKVRKGGNLALTKKEVEHVANLARLDLAEGEAEAFKGQLDAILSYVEKLKQLSTESVEPTSHAIPVNNVFREDIIIEPLGQARAVANAPDKADGCFRVPKVVE